MKKIKIGIIGPGNHFQKKILPALKKIKNVKILYILRKNKNRFLTFDTTNKSKIFFKNKFDFVYISSIPSTHEKYLNLCIKNNFNIICEKPIITNLKKTKFILKKIREKNLFIFETFSYIFNKSFIKLNNLLKGKEIKYIHSSFHFPFLKNNNFRYKSKEGGFFLDSAVYPISLETFLLENQIKNIKNLNTNTKFKKNIPINGTIEYDYLDQKRVFTWGTGLAYKNFLKIKLKDSIIFYKKIYTKTKDERIKILIRKNKKKKEILFKYYDQFELMFEYIFKNYKKYKIKSMFNQQILTNNQFLIKIMKEIKN
jgi:predicted dehydrogenase